MALIILKYAEATMVDGAAVGASVWNKIPLNAIIRDDNGNCVLNVDNTFTLSNPIYPKICRFDISCCIVNTAAGLTVAKARLLKVQAAVLTTIDTSINYSIVGGSVHQGVVKQITTFTLNKLTTFEIDVWLNRVGLFGKAASDGSEERYALVQITVE